MAKYKKGTFTVVPNLDMLSGQCTEVQAIFLWLCHYANDSGTCYPSRKKLAKNCNMTPKTLDKYINILINTGLIEKTYRKDPITGANTSNLYQIVLKNTLDSVSIDTYPSEATVTTPTPLDYTQTISNINYNQLTINKSTESSVTSVPEESEFSLVSILERLANSNDKKNKIIALYFYRKNFKFQNKLQFNTEYKRNTRPALDLLGYNSKQIEATMDYCEEQWGTVWTLETVVKRINNVIANSI